MRVRRLRAEIPGALYESGKSQLSLRVSEDPEQRFPAVVRAADILLEVTREAAREGSPAGDDGGRREAFVTTPPPAR